MKKVIWAGCVLFLVTTLAVLVPAKSSASKDKWEKGWVSDSKCGAKGAGVGHEQCGKKCLGEGEHVVFVNEFNHKVLNVDNPDKLKDLMGRRVAVKGNVDQTARTIHVDEVNPLPEKGKKKAEAASMDEMHK
jgi:hypothetical protein